MNYDREIATAPIYKANITDNVINSSENYYTKIEQGTKTDSIGEQATPQLSSVHSQYNIHGGYPLHIQASTDESTVGFDDWTPQDSSYGAAWPFCGWIPKKIRRRIETLIYFSTGIFVIYVLVMISMILFGSGNHRSTNTSSYTMDDDDHYISAKNDDADYRAYWSNYKDDDDFYNAADDKY